MEMGLFNDNLMEALKVVDKLMEKNVNHLQFGTAARSRDVDISL